MSAALAVGSVLAVACVALVALPFLREPRPQDDRLDQPDELEQRRLALAEERDRALAALKELEFDHRTGKVSDDDYRELVGPLRRRAAEALRALDLRAAQRGVELPEQPGQPGEGTPGGPAVIPEPYPPPDEGNPPEPAIIPEPGPLAPEEPEEGRAGA